MERVKFGAISLELKNYFRGIGSFVRPLAWHEGGEQLEPAILHGK